MKDSERGLTQSGPLFPCVLARAKLTARITLRTLTAPLTSVTALSSGHTHTQARPHTRAHTRPQTIQHVKLTVAQHFGAPGHRNAALAASNQVRVKQPYGSSSPAVRSSEETHGNRRPTTRWRPPRGQSQTPKNQNRRAHLCTHKRSRRPRLVLCIRCGAN